jgi:phosphohistidine phosphatase
MLTLYLLRHAKSSWDDSCLTDHDRPLAPRGERDAPRIGAYIGANFVPPTLIVCSTAERARATLRLVEPAITDHDIDITFERRIYEVPPSQLIAYIRDLPDADNVVLIIGHNPGMQGVALELTGHGESATIRNLAVKFPTAAVAVLRFEADRWADVRPASGRLEAFVRPKDLAA